MAAVGSAVAIGYFGKLPSRGDFVRAAEGQPLMATLDRWAGHGLELLAQDPAWKPLYDAAPPLHFAFLGSRSRVVIGGHLVPSRDSAQRRFPFLSAARLDVGQPLGFLARSPLALARLWAALARFGAQAVAAADAHETLRALTDSRIAIGSDPRGYDAPFDDFLALQDLGALQALLRQSGHAQLRLRWLLPALGLLLQPLLSGGAGRIDKGLLLPLPRDALYRPLVAALWLDLVSGFLGRAEFELALLVDEGAHDRAAGADRSGAPQLVIGFNGADGRLLQAALDPQVGAEQLIRVADAEWVESQLAGDYALNKLASYIDRDELPLRLARRAFGETFLGT